MLSELLDKNTKDQQQQKLGATRCSNYMVNTLLGLSKFLKERYPPEFFKDGIIRKKSLNLHNTIKRIKKEKTELLSIIFEKFNKLTKKEKRELKHKIPLDYNKLFKSEPILINRKFTNFRKPINHYIQEYMKLDSIIRLEDSIYFDSFLWGKTLIEVINYANDISNGHLERLYLEQLNKIEITDDMRVAPEFRKMQEEIYVATHS